MCARPWQSFGFESSADRHAVFLNKALTVVMSANPSRIMCARREACANLLISDLVLEKVDGN